MKKCTLGFIVFCVVFALGGCQTRSQRFAKILKSTLAAKMSGSAVNFSEVVIFGCANIPNNRYLFNVSQTEVCAIKNPEDAKTISSNLQGDFWGQNTVFFQVCTPSATKIDFCNPQNLRNF
jgi:hypothetical protein